MELHMTDEQAQVVRKVLADAYDSDEHWLTTSDLEDLEEVIDAIDSFEE